MTDKKYAGLPVRDQASDSIVAFYLTQETGPPANFQGNYQIATINVVGLFGKVVKRPALRVTFACNQSIKELVGLIALGSDARCHVQLPAGIASPVHCRIYAQLNSGPRMWLLEDDSIQGTRVEDDETLRDEITKSVHGCRQALDGLNSFRIGPYYFKLRAPISNIEVRQREDWFHCHRPIPVTKSMLHQQLGGRECDWLRMNRVGEGGFGAVYRYMEKQTGLYVAVKEEKLKHPGRELEVKKEVNFMEALCHPHLVDILFSECDQKRRPEPIQYTIMPLYLGNLSDFLQEDPDMETKERIIIQILEGVSYMHKNQVLHRDLKPKNIFWATQSPAIVKVGDFGFATSLADQLALLKPCGTAAYMAPEFFRRGVPQTSAGDVFSLGPTFFDILEPKRVVQGWYEKDEHQYNHVFDNVAKSPPKLYAGLIQSMMAPNPENRPSVDLCIEVVKGQHYNWTKETQLVPTLTMAPIAAIQHILYESQRPTIAAKNQQTQLDRARAWAIKRNLEPITQGMPLNHPQNPQQTLLKRNCGHKLDGRTPQEPQAPSTLAITIQAPRPSEPAPIQGVNFQDGLPSYEEATSKNPFAKLIDSREVTRRRRSKLNQPPEIAGPVGEQREGPVPRRTKKSNRKPLLVNRDLPVNSINVAVQPHISAANSQRSASNSTSMIRVPGRYPTSTHQIIRRPRDHSQALDIRRTGTGRIHKTPQTGIKASAAEMGKGLWHFGRGLGAATCIIGCLTGQGIMTLWDLAIRKDKVPNVGGMLSPLNQDEMRLVVGMRADSLKREGRTQRRVIGLADGEVEDAWSGGRRRLPGIREGVVLE